MVSCWELRLCLICTFHTLTAQLTLHAQPTPGATPAPGLAIVANNGLHVFTLRIRPDEQRSAASTAACRYLGLDATRCATDLTTKLHASQIVFVWRSGERSRLSLLTSNATLAAWTLCNEHRLGTDPRQVASITKQLREEATRYHDWMGTPEQRNRVRGLQANNVKDVTRAFDASRFSGTFLSIASKYYNGKIRSHPDLAEMYDHVLGPVRHRSMTLLEIGLGCTESVTAAGWFNVPCASQWLWQDQCVGYSIPLYREFLPLADIHIIEYNAPCAKAFQSRETRPQWRLNTEKLHIGDQSDTSFLRRIVDSMPGKTLDVVVDDGGHLFHQQITSFLTLFPLLRPGGIYIIEDLAHSFKKHDEESTLEFIKTLVEGIGMVSADGGKEQFVAESEETARYVESWKRAHPRAMQVLPMIFSLTYYGNNCVIVKR